MEEIDWARYPSVAQLPTARAWLAIQAALGLAPNTIAAYGRSLHDYLTFCRGRGVNPETTTRADVAAWVRDLRQRPHRQGAGITGLDSAVGLSNATLQQRLVAVRLYYDHLMEEGSRETNPVGRGRYTPGRSFGNHSERGLLPRVTHLPWIPTDEQWHAIVHASREEPIRNRVMLAFAYDAALRREELCSLRTDDLDPAHRTLRVRAETTKTRRERVIPYSATAGALLHSYLLHRRAISTARGPLFLSESRRNHAAPLTLWTWSKVVRAIALRAGVPHFSTHTLRHLCLTDLARAGWELHTIAQFAGHRNPATTLQYIHLSGRDLAAAMSRGMAQIHSWRMAQLSDETQETEREQSTP